MLSFLIALLALAGVAAQQPRQAGPVPLRRGQPRAPPSPRALAAREAIGAFERGDVALATDSLLALLEQTEATDACDRGAGAGCDAEKEDARLIANNVRAVVSKLALKVTLSSRERWSFSTRV